MGRPNWAGGQVGWGKNEGFWSGFGFGKVGAQGGVVGWWVFLKKKWVGSPPKKWALANKKCPTTPPVVN